MNLNFKQILGNIRIINEDISEAINEGPWDELLRESLMTAQEKFLKESRKKAINNHEGVLDSISRIIRWKILEETNTRNMEAISIGILGRVPTLIPEKNTGEIFDRILQKSLKEF